MKIGGVQKSLCNLLWSVADQYDITLYLFAPIGAYMHDIPPQVHVLSCDSLFRYLGTSQKDCSTHWRDYFIRGILACVCKLFGRKAILPLLLRSQEQLQTHYDCAISYLHNGAPHRFYGGVNEFVLKESALSVKSRSCTVIICNAAPTARRTTPPTRDSIQSLRVRGGVAALLSVRCRSWRKSAG